jgi:hypothetical protein
MFGNFVTDVAEDPFREPLFNNLFQTYVVVGEQGKKIYERETILHKNTISGLIACCQGIRIEIAY